MSDPITADAWDPQLECGAWRKQPRVIGSISHTHVCRRDPDHADRVGGEMRLGHLCTCGHNW